MEVNGSAEPNLPDRRSSPSPQSEASRQSIRTLLHDISVLLEDYGPTWYSQELGERIAAALRLLDEDH